MELRRIEQKKVLLAWHRHAQRLNEAQPLVRRTRRLPDGREQAYLTRPKAVTGSVAATAVRLILDYLAAYYASLSANLVAEAGELPSLSTNCPEMGRRRHVSDRTMRNHLAILRRADVGLVSRYAWHGSNANFELWVSPAFLWPETETAAEGQQTKLETDQKQNVQKSENRTLAALLSGQRKDFPHTVSCDTLETKEKENSAVEKGKNIGMAEPQGAGPKGAGAGHTPGHTVPGHIGPQQQAKRPKGRPPRPVAECAQATGAPGGAAGKPSQGEVFLGYVVGFWLYAWRVLYPGCSFTEHEQRQAKNAIYYGVYRGFKADFTKEEWEEVQEEMLQRLDLAAGYYRNHPDRHPPKPYAEWVRGTGYFDFENERGFKNTDGWLVKKLQWRRQERVEEALRRARRNFRDHRAGRAPNRIQQKSPLELFRLWEGRVRLLGQEALERFYAQHMTHQQFCNKKV